MTQPHPHGRPGALPPALGAMTLLAAAVIVHDVPAGRILLLQRGERAKFAPGRWDLPVGKSEPGEPVTGTAVRELHEETGLVVAPEALRVVHLVHGAWGAEAPNGFLTVVFATHEWSGEPRNLEPAKHAQVRWADTGRLPEPFVESSAMALRGYFADGPLLSLRGWS